MPGTLPGFLTQFGLNLLSTPPQGGLFQTAATAAKDPFETFQAAQFKIENVENRYCKREFEQAQLETELAAKRKSWYG